MGLLRAHKDADKLLVAAEAAGLHFAADPGEEQGGTHKTRIRVLAPRILAAYDDLSGDERLVAGQAALRALRDDGFDMEAVSQSFNAAGWELRDTGFVVRSPETRELFFPKGSQWDAFVVLRDLMARAGERIIVVDPYCDDTVFEMLAQPRDGLTLEILCSRTSAGPLVGAARRFREQYPGVTVRVRATRDFHDRFVVLDDDTCIHVGASINHAGRTAFMVSVVEDHANRDALLQQIRASWQNATEAT